MTFGWPPAVARIARLRPQPAISGIGIDAEIADQEGGQDIKAKSGERGSQASAGNHGRTMALSLLKRV